MMAELSKWKHLHRSERKRWTDKWFIMFVRHVMMIEINESEGLDRNDQKR